VWEASKKATAQADISQAARAEVKIRCITELCTFHADSNDAFAGAGKYKCKLRLFGKFFAAHHVPVHLRSLFIKLEFILSK
jgi:hypothetical protein